MDEPDAAAEKTSGSPISAHRRSAGFDNGDVKIGPVRFG
jgi:hypothetical protein